MVVEVGNSIKGKVVANAVPTPVETPYMNFGCMEFICDGKQVGIASRGGVRADTASSHWVITRSGNRRADGGGTWLLTD